MIHVLELLMEGISKILYQATGHPVYSSFAKSKNIFPCFYLLIDAIEHESKLYSHYMMRVDIKVRFFSTKTGEETTASQKEKWIVMERLPLLLEVVELQNGEKVRSDGRYEMQIAEDTVEITLSYPLFMARVEKSAEFMRSLRTGGNVENG